MSRRETEDYLGAKRHLWKGEFRTGERKAQKGVNKAAVAVDTTGSIAGDFPQFISEVVNMTLVKDINETHNIPFASDVKLPNVRIHKGIVKGADFKDVILGGGNENIDAPVKYIEEYMKGKPAFVVIITDGYLWGWVPDAEKRAAGGTMPHPPKWAAKKCIWLCYSNEAFKVPPAWGKVVHVDAEMMTPLCYSCKTPGCNCGWQGKFGTTREEGKRKPTTKHTENWYAHKLVSRQGSSLCWQ